VKLLITPKPEKDEGFISYLLRLTEANGYDTPSWILSLSGIDYMELQWKFTFVFSCSEGLKKLAKLTGNTLSDLIGLLYLPAPSPKHTTCDVDYNFYGAFFNRSIIRPHCPKVCVQCLAEFGYCRRVWDCSLVTVCPLHHCLLLDACPKCERRLKAIRNRLSVCVCGCDWSELQPDLRQEHEITVSRLIYQLCGLLPLDHPSSDRNRLQSLALQDFVIVLTFIAGIEREISWATGRPSKSIKLRNEDLHGYFTKAYQVFEHWPHNFHQFLDKKSKGDVRFNPRDGKLDTALKEEFGALFEQLYGDLRGSQFDFLREAFAQYVNNRLRMQYQNVYGFFSVPESNDDDQYITVTEARRLLKISHDSLLNLVKTGEIAFAIRSQDRILHYLLRLADVESVKIKCAQALGSRELAEALGVDHNVISRLIKEGRLRRKPRRTIDAYHTPKFDVDTARRLLRKHNMASTACMQERRTLH